MVSIGGIGVKLFSNSPIYTQMMCFQTNVNNFLTAEKNYLEILGKHRKMQIFVIITLLKCYIKGIELLGISRYSTVSPTTTFFPTYTLITIKNNLLPTSCRYSPSEIQCDHQQNLKVKYVYHPIILDVD